MNVEIKLAIDSFQDDREHLQYDIFINGEKIKSYPTIVEVKAFTDGILYFYPMAKITNTQLNYDSHNFN